MKLRDRLRHAPSSERGRPRAWRRALRLVGWVTLIGLAIHGAKVLVLPSPSVGHWRSADGEQRYAQAYQRVLSGLPTAESVVVEVPQGSVHVLRWAGPADLTPVLLLPGRSSGAPMWAENLPDWIGTRPIHAVDPIGDAGLSSQRVPLTSVADQSAWIAATMKALGLTSAHVVGHSFGGATAAQFAVDHPELVATLTLIEPVMVIRMLPASTFGWATLTQLPLPQAIKDHALAKIGGTTVAEVRERSPLSDLIDIAASNYSAALPTPSVLTDDQWRSLTMPVRIDIAGGQSLAGGQGAVDRMRALLPHAQVTLWPDTTHSLPMQAKAALDPALVQFWSTH